MDFGMDPTDMNFKCLKTVDYNTIKSNYNFYSIWNFSHVQDLMKELKSELSGKLCTATMAMGEPSNEYDANECRKVSKSAILIYLGLQLKF